MAEVTEQDDEYRIAFLELVDDVCSELGYPPRGAAPESDEALAMEMELDGVPFAVVHMRNTVQDRVLIECRFGTIPQDRALAVMMRLLQLNRGFADLGERAFGIDADTGDVIFTTARDLFEATGSSLLSVMTEMTWQARQWNDNYFLDEASQPAAAGLPLHMTSLA
ncbi:MAG: CesT family type III secretion system chaperone [Janthinobacterium lividum]